MDKIHEIIPSVLAALEKPEAKKRNTLYQRWAEVVGETLAERTKPSLSQSGCLFVWVEAAALAQDINQKGRLSILKRAQALVGEEAVKNVKIMVGQIR